jgi:hypothetical protein
MKTLLAAVVIFCATLVLTSKTDPFNAQQGMLTLSKIASDVVSPQARYAVASSDNVSFATVSMSAVPQKLHRTDPFSMINFDAAKHQASLDKLCDTAPDDVRQSDAYQLYCHQ